MRLQRASYRVEADLIGFEDLPPLRETPEELTAVQESFLGAYEGERLLGAIAFFRHRPGSTLSASSSTRARSGAGSPPACSTRDLAIRELNQ